VISLDLHTEGIRVVFGGLRFPASRWQIIAQAQYWGTDHLFLDELGHLPEGTYASLAEVCDALKKQRTMASRERAPLAGTRRRALSRSHSVPSWGAQHRLDHPSGQSALVEPQPASLD
jgi:hypothetical protein